MAQFEEELYKPGTWYKYNGINVIGDRVRVAEWQPEKWRQEGCIGNFDYRSGFIPVYSPKFPSTMFWWVAPHNLEELKGDKA